MFSAVRNTTQLLIYTNYISKEKIQKAVHMQLITEKCTLVYTKLFSKVKMNIKYYWNSEVESQKSASVEGHSSEAELLFCT